MRTALRGCWEGRIMWLSCNSAPGSLRCASIAASFPHPVSAFLLFFSSLCCVVVLYCCIVVLYFCFCSGFARSRSFRCGSLLCLLASKRNETKHKKHKTKRLKRIKTTSQLLLSTRTEPKLRLTTTTTLTQPARHPHARGFPSCGLLLFSFISYFRFFWPCNCTPLSSSDRTGQLLSPHLTVSLN